MLLVSKSEWSLNWDENLRFLIKKNLFDDSCTEFSPFLKISAQWTLAISLQVELDQKKYRRKESDSLVRLKMLFSWWVLCITFHCPHSCASSYCNLLHWVSLLKSTYAWGKKMDHGEPSPFSEFMQKSRQQDHEWQRAAQCFGAFQVPSCKPLLLAFWGQHPSNTSCLPEAPNLHLAEFYPMKDHSAAQNSSSKGPFTEGDH